MTHDARISELASQSRLRNKKMEMIFFTSCRQVSCYEKFQLYCHRCYHNVVNDVVSLNFESSFSSAMRALPRQFGKP